MNELHDPVEKGDLDDAITTIMVHSQDQGRQLLSGLLTTAIILIVAFLLGNVWGVLIVLVIMRILQVFHPGKKAAAAVKRKHLSRNR